MALQQSVPHAKVATAHSNRQLIEFANNGRRNKWLGDLHKGERFYEDEQIDEDELEDLEDANMPTFTSNRSTPVIDTQKYFITANNPRWSATGRGGDDSMIAGVAARLMDYSFEQSNGKMHMGQVALDILTKSKGVPYLYVDKDADRGMGEVMFGTINPEDVYEDPTCRDMFARDAAWIQVARNMSKTSISNKLPQFHKEIWAASGAALTDTGGDGTKETKNSQVNADAINGYDGQYEEVIPYIETYRRVPVEFVNLMVRDIPSPDAVREMQMEGRVSLEELAMEVDVSLQEKEAQFQKMVDAQEMLPTRMELEMSKERRRLEQQLDAQTEAFASAVEQLKAQIKSVVIRKSEYEDAIKKGVVNPEDILEEILFWDMRVKLECSVGDDTMLYEIDLDYKHYPLVPIPYVYTGNIYPISSMKYLMGKQEEINKAHQLMIHNATLSSNGQWLVNSGSVIDMDVWTENSTMPGGILEYVYSGPESKPERIMPLPLNNAFYTIMNEGKNELEYTAGVNSGMMGMADVSDRIPFRSLMANDEFGTRKLKAWIDSVFEPALTHIGNVFVDISQHVYKAHKIFRIVNENGFEDYELNVPLYDKNGEISGKYLDYETANFDIRVVAGSTFPTNREMRESKYYEYFKDGLIPDTTMIKYTDIEDKEAVIKEKSLQAQQQNQIESLNDELKKLKGDNETLERQVIQSRIKINSMSGEMETRKGVLETETALQQFENKAQLALDKHIANMAQIEKEAKLATKPTKPSSS